MARHIQARAAQAGSVPGAPGPAGILGDGQTAFRLTGHGIQWWDMSDPAHPVLRDVTALPGAAHLATAVARGLPRRHHRRRALRDLRPGPASTSREDGYEVQRPYRQTRERSWA